MSTTDSKIVPRLVIIVLGLSGALLALGALIGLSESHAGTADMVRHGWIQLFVGASSVVWSFVAAVRWRTTSPMLLSLVAVGAAQLCLYHLIFFYDGVRYWDAIPTTISLAALASAGIGWFLLFKTAR